MNNESKSSPSGKLVTLWAVVVVSLAANVAAQAIGLGVYVSAAFGVVAVVAGVALYSSYRKRRADGRG
ncbi:hypothetical protein ACFFQW_11665 [Umezawaea endophytica]|uniref:Uncharacterized protein n=1 Tax=Umezawaea endophytica TaxID=1654476 RepID=A0A9X3A454_9PSEU|nr:hypothetical protein [Umezawaea endophytica]MCS7482504.1 hypothetical protein [Umezawaea endophytica]